MGCSRLFIASKRATSVRRRTAVVRRLAIARQNADHIQPAAALAELAYAVALDATNLSALQGQPFGGPDSLPANPSSPRALGTVFSLPDAQNAPSGRYMLIAIGGLGILGAFDGHTPAATNWPMTHRRRPPAHTSYQSFAHATTIRFCNSPTALTEAASLASSICGASVDGRT